MNLTLNENQTFSSILSFSKENQNALNFVQKLTKYVQFSLVWIFIKICFFEIKLFYHKIHYNALLASASENSVSNICPDSLKSKSYSVHMRGDVPTASTRSKQLNKILEKTSKSLCEAINISLREAINLGLIELWVKFGKFFR